MELDTLDDVQRRNNGRILEEIPKAMKRNSSNQIPKALKELERKQKYSDYDRTENLINKNDQNSNLQNNNYDSRKKLDDMTKVMSRQNLDKMINAINTSKQNKYKSNVSEDLGELPKALNHNPLGNIVEQEDQFEKESINHNAEALNNSKVKKKKKKRWKVLKIFFITIFMLICLFVLFIILFFKTTLFQEWKELWVQTAMTTMNHQYLATWFLSEDEINAIMNDNVVINNEDSILNSIEIDDKDNDGTTAKPKENVINVDKISGSGYVGYVMTVSDPSKVKFVDSRKKTTGTQLSQICKEHNAIAGINAGGFTDPNGNGYGNLLNEPTIIDRKLLYGDKNSVINLTGLTHSGELVLGRYTYHQAMNIGIESGIQFGPYIIVNGNKQIKKANQGGLHPRMAIGQKKDGTMIFVCIDGRQPGYSIGTTLLEVQNIFERYGAYNAANLDGGSSATMYYNGKVVNKTSTPIGERYLPNAIIVTK